MNPIYKIIGDGYHWITRFLRTHLNSFHLYQKAYNEQYFSNLFQHDRMFADTLRVETYFKAIQKYVKPEHCVLDLGTGSGIFAFFAALKHPRQIYAVDHCEIIRTAKSAAFHNQIKNIIFIKKNSKHLNSHIIPEKFDIIIHDQIGSWLFNENLIESLLDVRDRFLKSDGRILPGEFQLFIEPVQLKIESRIPFIWEHEIHSISFESLKIFQENVPPKYFYRRLLPYDVDYFLGQPAPIFQFNLKTLHMEQVPDTLQNRRIVVQAGQWNGFCFYFNVIFDDTICFSTSPMHRPHVYQTWSIPFYRIESRSVQVGDTIEMRLKMKDIRDPRTWMWEYNCCS